MADTPGPGESPGPDTLDALNPPKSRKTPRKGRGTVAMGFSGKIPGLVTAPLPPVASDREAGIFPDGVPRETPAVHPASTPAESLVLPSGDETVKPVGDLAGKAIPSEPVTEGPGEVPEARQGAIEDPIEILVGLAERGEIDPWNINIIEVTDKFLSELERRRELNLQLSGRTLFFAATLLRMKSEQIEQLYEPEEEEGDGDDLFGDVFGNAIDSEIDYTGRLGPIERLEHEIQRRLDRKSMRQSPITLFELILELKNIEKMERRRRRMNNPDGDSFLYEADDIVSIAHDEDYEGSAITIGECFEHVIEGEMSLAELCTELGWGVSDVYIPLLFLAIDGRCTLRQEEFYGDVYVQISRVDAERIVPETIAE